jgi:hypothetical protein
MTLIIIISIYGVSAGLFYPAITLWIRCVEGRPELEDPVFLEELKAFIGTSRFILCMLTPLINTLYTIVAFMDIFKFISKLSKKEGDMNNENKHPHCPTAQVSITVIIMVLIISIAAFLVQKYLIE